MVICCVGYAVVCRSCFFYKGYTVFNSNNITNVALIKWVMNHVVLSVGQAPSILGLVHHPTGHLTHDGLGVVLADDQGLDGPLWEHHEIKHLGNHGVQDWRLLRTRGYCVLR